MSMMGTVYDLERAKALGIDTESLLAENAKLRARVDRLERIAQMPLSSTELKLIDKNCDWVAFGHAWNAVMKSRLDRKE